MRTKSTLRRLTIETLESRQLLAFDPTGFEQELLEHVNRMRMNPSEELAVLFDSQPQPLVATDPLVQAAIQYFSVDGTVLKTQWEQLRPASPLAWNPSLLNAARAHSQAMIEHNRLSHQLPGEAPLGTRIRESGYGPYRAVGENAFAHAQSPMHAHAGFAIDWGGTPTGIQDGHGHRTNLMNPAYTEIGIGVLQQHAAPGKVGPLVVTQNFARPTSPTPYLLGVVYEDTNGNGRYDAGEGLAGIPVHIQSANGASYTTQTMSAGGYQLQVPPGTYQVSIALLDSTDSMVDQVSVAGSNVKVDFVVESGEAEPDDTRSPWQNPEDWCDVNGDGFITPQDALMIINLVTERGPYRLADAPWDGKWWDVNGDGLVTALDALIVINRLNAWGSHPALPGSVSDPEQLDVNRDGTITRADADIIVDYVSGRHETCTNCDVNNDGRISPLDALLILNHVLAKEGVKASDPAHVLGVVYADINEDGQYSQAEGIAGIPVYFRGENHMVIHQLITEGPYRRSTDDESHDAALTELQNAQEDSPFDPLFDDVVDLLALAG